MGVHPTPSLAFTSAPFASSNSTKPPNNQLHQNLPALALFEGNQQVATKPDESLSPSLFTFRSHFASTHRN
jgi:hypothetical protein